MLAASILAAQTPAQVTPFASNEISIAAYKDDGRFMLTDATMKRFAVIGPDTLGLIRELEGQAEARAKLRGTFAM